jgi:type I restriction enzyme S subunit
VDRPSQAPCLPLKGSVRFLQIRDYASERHLASIPESNKNRLGNADDIMIGGYGDSVGKILTGRAGAYNVALIKAIPDFQLLDKDFFFNYLTSGATRSVSTVWHYRAQRQPSCALLRA